MRSQELSELRQADVERVRTKATFPQVFIYILNQADLAEFALILECEAMRIGENEEHSRMPARRSLGRGWSRRLLLIFGITQRAGHAEMQSQPKVAIGAHEKMFAVTTAGFEGASFQSPFELTRRNAFQHVRAPHIDSGDSLVQ